jgi:outer membrane protein assembly factor BamB
MSWAGAPFRVERGVDGVRFEDLFGDEVGQADGGCVFAELAGWHPKALGAAAERDPAQAWSTRRTMPGIPPMMPPGTSTRGLTMAMSAARTVSTRSAAASSAARTSGSLGADQHGETRLAASIRSASLRQFGASTTGGDCLSTHKSGPVTMRGGGPLPPRCAVKPLTVRDPTAIASYRLLGVLGSGGMGRVYLGQSPSGRPVAIKVVRADLVDDPAARRRFAREVAAARMVSPLYTAAVVDADTAAESPWLATLYIDGPSLEQWVDEHGALVPRAVLTLAAGLAEAVGSIHRAGLVHRDVKPSNVLLTTTGPHVIDFGLAVGPQATRLSFDRPVGTPSYMAPECIHGEEAGPPADIFSLGATLVFAATGRSLVESEAFYAKIIRITQGRFELSEVPADLRELVARCLSLRPQDRPTAAELVRILTADGIPAPKPGWYETASAEPLGVVLNLPPRPGRLSRRRLLATSGAVGFAALGGAGAWLATPERTEDRPASVATPPRPGTVLWLARSGAYPTAGSPSATRIIPDGAGRVVAASVSEVFAQTVEGRRLWTHPLPGRFVDANAREGAVLVADTTGLSLLDRASGRQRFTVDTASSLRAWGAVRHVVSSGDRAFVDMDTGTVALDEQGRTLWEQAAGSPLAADARWLLTYDRTGDTVQVGLQNAATGRRRWMATYAVGTRPPVGAPPAGGPRKAGPGGGPPLFDDAWRRREAHIAAELVAVRDGQDLRALRLRDGRTAWQKAWPTPIAATAVAGGLLLVGADRLSALTLATGAQVWQLPLRGARMAVSADTRTIAVAAERTITAVDPAGTPHWQTDLPTAVSRAVPDQVTLDRHTAFVTFKPQDQQVEPLDIDVVAVALGVG